eukprot:UN33844
MAIAGITISVGPALYHITKPIRDWLKRVIEWVLDNIIVPTIRFCHENSIFELLMYYGCTLIIAEGLNLPEESGFYVTLTGYALSTLAVGYSTFLHGGVLVKDMAPETVTQLAGLFMSLLFYFPSVHFQSSLLGWFSVISLYSALGFSVTCRGLCWLIGWRSKDALYRCLCASMIFTATFVGLRIGRVSSIYLTPLVSPMTIMGSVLTQLGLMIISSRHVADSDHFWRIIL